MLIKFFLFEEGLGRVETQQPQSQPPAINLNYFEDLEDLFGWQENWNRVTFTCQLFKQVCFFC